MYLVVELDERAMNGGSLALEDPDDFRSFKVIAPESAVGSDSQVGRVLKSYGRLDDEASFYILPTVLIELAGERAEVPEWLQSLDDMIAFAQARGWVDDTGAIQAHIEARGA